MSVSVFAPASIGNVNVGFDVLGLAVKPVDGTFLGDVISVEKAELDQLTVTGAFADKLPKENKQNIVWDCLLLFNRHLALAGHRTVPVAITLDKKMPVGSGLGSSACSVVGAIKALNEFYRQYYDVSFDQQTLLRMMGEMEAQISGSLHYDNVAPCFLGGLQLMVPNDNVIARALPIFEDCFFVMAYPGINVSTKAAREVLPDAYPKSDVIAFGQNLATFVDACHRQDKQQAFSVLKDVIAEPYRQNLLPGFKEACDYLTAEQCLAVGISGSGPTLFCVTDNQDKAEQYAAWLADNYLVSDAEGHGDGFVHVCKADAAGAVLIEASAQ
ncbi:homoserine kinase [Thalassotalea fusca]